MSQQPGAARCLFESFPYEMQTLHQLSHSPGQTWGEGGMPAGLWGAQRGYCPALFALEKGHVGSES